MTGNQRIVLVLAALAVAVVAFVVVQPGGDDDDSEQASNTPAQTEAEGSGGSGATAPEETEAAPPEPEVTCIQIRGGNVVGGAKDIEVQRGDTVRIVVTEDAEDAIHLHGYDIEREVGPGSPARFRFKADAEGAFEMESHKAEDAGRDPLVARLIVSPS